MAYGQEQARYRPVNQMQRPMTEPPNPMGAVGAPGAMTEPPNPMGAVGGGDFQSRRMGPGGDLTGAPGMPGGRTPASAGGFRRFQPMSGQQGMGGRPGIGQQRPGVGAVAPRPAAPPAPPALPPAPPMPPAPPALPPMPGVPDGSMAGQTFLPGEDARLGGAQTRTDSAMKAITDGADYSGRAGTGADRFRKVLGNGSVEGGPDVDAVDGGRYLDDQDAAIAGLGGPSRTDLAKTALADFEKQGEAGLANRFRKVGQSAAKFGRIGMGDVNAELGSIQGDYERDLMGKRNELARDVSEGDISDRFRRVDATSGLRRGESGIESGLRDERRSERGYDSEIDIGNQDRAFDRQRSAIDFGGRDASQDIGNEYDELGAAGSLEDRIFGQGQQNRGEFRGERGYQDSRRQQSLDEIIRRRELENSEQDSAFRRSLAMSNAGR